MGKRLSVTILTGIIGFSSSVSAISPEQCRVIAKALSSAQTSHQGLVETLQDTPLLNRKGGIDFSTMKSEVSAMDQTRLNLVNALKAHLAAMQDFNYQLQRCAR